MQACVQLGRAPRRRPLRPTRRCGHESGGALRMPSGAPRGTGATPGPNGTGEASPQSLGRAGQSAPRTEPGGRLARLVPPALPPPTGSLAGCAAADAPIGWVARLLPLLLLLLRLCCRCLLLLLLRFLLEFICRLLLLLLLLPLLLSLLFCSAPLALCGRFRCPAGAPVFVPPASQQTATHRVSPVLSANPEEARGPLARASVSSSGPETSWQAIRRIGPPSGAEPVPSRSVVLRCASQSPSASLRPIATIAREQAASLKTATTDSKRTPAHARAVSLPMGLLCDMGRKFRDRSNTKYKRKQAWVGMAAALIRCIPLELGTRLH